MIESGGKTRYGNVRFRTWKTQVEKIYALHELTYYFIVLLF